MTPIPGWFEIWNKEIIEKIPVTVTGQEYISATSFTFGPLKVGLQKHSTSGKKKKRKKKKTYF